MIASQRRCSAQMTRIGKGKPTAALPIYRTLTTTAGPCQATESLICRPEPESSSTPRGGESSRRFERLSWTAPLSAQLVDPDGLVPLVNQFDRLTRNLPKEPSIPSSRRRRRRDEGMERSTESGPVLACQTDSPSRQAGWSRFGHKTFPQKKLRSCPISKWRCPIRRNRVRPV
jgi:hypothetical protein